MRHHHQLTALLIACVLSLSACTQSASVGIPTPDRVSQSPTVLAPAPSTATSVAQAPAQQPTQSLPTPQPQPQQTEPVPTVQAPAPAPTEPIPTEPAPPVVTDTSTDIVVCNQMVSYIVKPGENLFRIGLRYKTTALTIARRNHIADTRKVRTGAQLRILTCE